jgi:hypothetical protein
MGRTDSERPTVGRSPVARVGFRKAIATGVVTTAGKKAFGALAVAVAENRRFRDFEVSEALRRVRGGSVASG